VSSGLVGASGPDNWAMAAIVPQRNKTAETFEIDVSFTSIPPTPVALLGT
jgi:hypothetical protein